jgi:hypothetical protein
MNKIKKDSWSTRPVDTEDYAIEPLLKMVDEGKATIKAGLGMNDLVIEIKPKAGDYYYSGRFNLTWQEFNQKYGKDYIDKYNLYL